MHEAKVKKSWKMTGWKDGSGPAALTVDVLGLAASLLDVEMGGSLLGDGPTPKQRTTTSNHP